MPDPTFTAAPASIPSRATPSTFSALTDPFLTWEKTFRNELSTSVSWFSLAVTDTAAAAAAAAASSTAAASSAGAALWVSATAYTTGDAAVSPITLLTYRANTATSGTTDPSASADWVSLGLNEGGGVLTGPLKTLELQETVVTLSGTTPAVDCEAGTVFTLSTTGNTTFTFTNPAVTGTASAFTLKLTAGGTHTITWPASVDWAAATAPDAPASGETDILVFWTHDGGTTWYGAIAVDAAA